ncbi:AMP-binding protein [Actinospica sp. MGRD01-02]|uniref:AMP-binding protein n=1 Tax=Actinospica acidithermotolerans TaxID=2828514 RepID=A0A941EGA6_9ACTN|nr:AMP-binding protein [Actinospica acidithermotolerans]MBR7829972.1 AMP-binding protein [Actinospica acidithermotolerans]
MTFASPFPPVSIPDVSLYDYLFANLDPAADLDRTAFVDVPTGNAVTYRELRDDVVATAGALSAIGVAPGEVVALHAPNGPDYGVAFHGVLRAGAAVTTMPVLATPEDIAKQLKASHAVAMLADPIVAANALAGAEAAGLPADRVILLRETGDAAHAGRPVLRTLIASAPQPPEVELDPATQLAALPYSSGTTGRPKGVRLSHRNLVANIAQIEDRIGVQRDDVVIAVLPFFHIYGMTVLLNYALRRRSTLVTMPRFDLAEFLGAIARHRVTFAFIAPPIAVALAKHPAVEDYDLSSLRVLFCGAAPLDGDLGRALADRLGVAVLQGYGMSELSPVSHFTPEAMAGEVSCESVGFAVPNSENKLLDPATGKEIPKPESGVSERGELCIKGPNVMLGYLDDADATDAMIDADGFLHTGDVATVDARGCVTIVDRIKELIKYKGYQVAPAELEALLLTHPSIADAAVIGVHDADGEEVPKAFVVRRGADALTGQQVMDYVAERVAPYKKVRVVEFIDVVPKSASGKILRRELRDREKA